MNLHLHPPTRTDKAHVHEGIRVNQYTRMHEIPIFSVASKRLHTHPNMHTV